MRQSGRRAVRWVGALALPWLVAAYPGNAGERHVEFTGVNLSGGEFPGHATPARYGQDYLYPNEKEIDYFLDAGMNVIRLPFLWERLQPTLGAALDPIEAQRIDAIVAHVTARGAAIVLDPHNYARYSGAVVGSPEVPVEHFADLWRRLAQSYKANGRVIFGLMNEPHDMPAQSWRTAVDRAVAAIRGEGARNLVLVPGVAWSGAHSFVTASSAAMANIADPQHNYAYELHQYFDGDFSGRADTCQSKVIGVDSLRSVTAWLRAKKQRGFLGEFGAGRGTVCIEALKAILHYMNENADVWLGWTYWTGGPWMVDYRFSVEPKDGIESPQMAVIRQFAVGSSPQARR
jgi:endoglucanase